ncbi:MAG TPA: response regulator [Gemmatimonadales bacterium]|jgi:DNA-binding NtrC family response regulator|nr:response regulator [Gemmatimonadales bacterium]
MTARVLIIDDETSLRQTLERALRSFGYEVDSAPDPLSAYHLLGDATYDVVLLDLRLRQAKGDALYLALVRQWPYLRGRVMLMSGDPWSAQDTWPPELVACPLLVKPFTLDTLAGLVARIAKPDIRTKNGSA